MTIAFADPVSAAPTQTETRELAYYRQLANYLGKDLQRTQQFLEVTSNALRRFQELHRLGRQLSLVGATTTDEVFRCFFETLAGLNICSRALLVREHLGAPGAFAIHAALEIDRGSLPEHFKLPMVPEFGLVTTTHTHPPSATDSLSSLRSLMGLPSILWAYDIETGFALVLAIAPGPANTDFRPEDRDFAIALLGVLLDAYRRLQAANAAAREAAGLLPDKTSGNIFRINEAKPLISEAEVERMLRADERVQHALYIEWDDIHSFVFLAFDTTKGYSLLRRYRGQSPRTFKDPRAIIRFGREGLRYRGELAIYPRDDARVAALVEYARPLMAAAAAREQDPEARPVAPTLLSEYLSNRRSEEPAETARRERT